ncbi:PAS domain-containing sensor histidine kinase [Phyllobacterium sp. 21LDTY02-6]|uniref:sensor histidine kinase n=1 Tax=Phyllobacterium sp. 21LDTY02-6 TaxID=2944903 RepID=UPI002021CD9D|nr:PAS domain-containing sensor histidine kinase [Phyllobacterium sp. 21LDTY02-6]MCO4315910.1 PAS domain-containing sensor histidine kinase [Phyllobacterium sp. 21LDTY02-6]
MSATKNIEKPQVLPRGALGMTLLVLASTIISFVIMMGVTGISPTKQATQIIIAANAVSILILIYLSYATLRKLILFKSKEKHRDLHTSITIIFALIASIPSIIVACFSLIVLDNRLNSWINPENNQIIDMSIKAAQSYTEDNAQSLLVTTLSMVIELDERRMLYSLDRSAFSDWLTYDADRNNLLGASLVRSDGEAVVTARLFNDLTLPPVPLEALAGAAGGKPVLIPPGATNLVGAVMKTQSLPGLYLYTIRAVDPSALGNMRVMTDNNLEYQALASNRTNTQITYALLYVELTLLLLLTAVWTGIAVANRVVQPIRLLIGAAEDVATGNFDVSVPVKGSDGDIGALSQTFNKMVEQLKTQHSALISAKDEIDERRRFTEAVLSGVTAGVISVNADGKIAGLNRPAEAMFGVTTEEATGRTLIDVMPEIGEVFALAAENDRHSTRKQIGITHNGVVRSFNVQITREEAETRHTSYVVTVDDITDLVAAHRSSAWADVARRIAHEIKNPLTPIQLSAERIRRRYGKVIVEDRAVFEQCTDTIIRQVGDIGRMVDEFSAFARMPKPELTAANIVDILRDASFLIEISKGAIKIEHDFADESLMGNVDGRLLGQAFGNIIKNASESIEAALESGAIDQGHVLVRAKGVGTSIVVEVLDNGKGLPQQDRHKLLEPYVTTREKGTGLGLAIVKKIIEDHGGQLEMHDAPQDFHGGRGALVRVVFPRLIETAAA